MKSLATTQSSRIRINAVLPGLLLTEWVRNTPEWAIAPFSKNIDKKKGERFPPEFVKTYEERTPLKHVVSCTSRQQYLIRIVNRGQRSLGSTIVPTFISHSQRIRP